jgi:hypothetical protein
MTDTFAGASGADLMRPAVSRFDPRFDQVANQAWRRQHWRRLIRSIGSPIGARFATATAIIVASRRGRRNRNYLGRNRRAESSVLMTLSLAPPKGEVNRQERPPQWSSLYLIDAMSFGEPLATGVGRSRKALACRHP